MSIQKKGKTQLFPNKYKRLPPTSHTIIFHSSRKKDRDDFINSEEFKNAYGELAKILLNYNSSIEIIKWDFLIGQKKKS